MKVPFQLRRLPEPEPAHALLLPGHDVPALLALCARLGALPRVHVVAPGFLLKLPHPAAGPFPGGLRLRRLAEDLFVPADAELVPALRDDEAAGLVRRRGLVFLPGGRVLAFAPDKPLTPADLLTAAEVRRPTWQALPPRPPLPDRIREILLDRPDDTSDAVLEAGGAGIGSEAPQPPGAAPATELLGRARLAAGQGLLNLGKALGLRTLAELGAGLIGGALSQVPRLSESLLGRQEAALRDLLREFREGSLERALRRALPLGAEADRGRVVSQGDRLPVHGGRYSLSDLLGSGGGPAGIWFGGYDVQLELAKEYRKAAEQALAAGDHRRAAFIYGKLLRDCRLAAQTLMRGGLHHDAAILYLEKLGDTLAAARAFEAAGEVDRAVQLYRQRGDHLDAAKLLRRAGEEEAALLEYRAAADKLLLSPTGCLAAGELMLREAGRADLAQDYFGRGWALRPEGNAVPCALHLAELYAQESSPELLLGLLGEAGAFFEPPGNDQAAGQFYNRVAQLAGRDNLAPVRDDLRDRCLLGLAGKLRQNAVAEARAGDLSSALLGRSGSWAPAVVSDAGFAVQAALKRPRPAVPPEPRAHSVPVLPGIVTAACSAPGTGRVFLGNERGDVACFDPLSGRILQVQRASGLPVGGLATEAEGHFLAVIEVMKVAPHHPLMASVFLSGESAAEFERFVGAREVVARGNELTPLVAQGAADLVGLWQGDGLELLKAPFLLPAGRVVPQAPGTDPTAALILGAPPNTASSTPSYLVLLLAQGSLWCSTFPGSGRREPAGLGWVPASPAHSTLYAPPLSCLRPHADHLELAGVRADGNACWSLVQFGRDGQPVTRMTNVTRGSTYQAAALVRPNLVAAVGTYRIDWLRSGFAGFAYWSATHLSLPAVVAAFPSHPTRELLLACTNGVVVRVPVPN
jgi:tetratricopeptide (TPR) repeat protein